MRAEYAKVYVGDKGGAQQHLRTDGDDSGQPSALASPPPTATAARALNESTNSLVLFRLQQLQSMSLANFVLAVITLVYLG